MVLLQPDRSFLLRPRLCALVIVMALAGCASAPRQLAPAVTFPNLSPAAAEVAPTDAWRLAERYASAHAGCEVLVGRGGSMLPLYRDRTVLVVHAQKMGDLRPGMTVVFVGDRGQMVAHTLVAETPRGWIARGIANGDVDATPIRFANYIGTVIRAYAPNPAIAPLNRTVADVGSFADIPASDRSE